ncbi:MAG: hypothetical protein AB7U30_02605 [Sulfuricellaceae bacterium]|jgi:hypothetical protein
MDMMIDVVRLAGMIAVASGLVALMFLLWRFIVSGIKEEIEVERFRGLARNLRVFIAAAKKAASETHPHPRALAEWLDEGLGWANKEGEARSAEQFIEHLKAVEAPALKQRDDEIARLKARLEPLEQLEKKVAHYREVLAPPEEAVMMTEADRRKMETEIEKTRQGMFDLVRKIENE